MACARIRLILFPVVLFFSIQAPTNQPVSMQPPLEVRLANALKWENGCLNVSLDLVNRSPKTLFLPTMGFYIDSSARLLSSAPDKNGSEEWINIYGVSDILRVLVTMPLAPGAVKHYEYCASSTVGVVDLGKELWREIPVRGKLRIDAQYYLTDPTPHTDRKQSNESEEPLRRRFAAQQPRPQEATLIANIPCPENGCARGCDGSPSILESESVIVPDVFRRHREWVERGKERNEELRKSFPCSK